MLLLLSTKFRTETGLSWPPVVKCVELLKAVFENALLFGKDLFALLRKAPGGRKEVQRNPCRGYSVAQNPPPLFLKIPTLGYYQLSVLHANAVPC